MKAIHRSCMIDHSPMIIDFSTLESIPCVLRMLFTILAQLIGIQTKMCTLYIFISHTQALVTYSSTYVLVALSIDRFDAITRPMNFTGSCKYNDLFRLLLLEHRIETKLHI